MSTCASLPYPGVMMVFGLLLAAHLSTVQGSVVNFYVDPVSGNDGNSGGTSGSSIRSISKLIALIQTVSLTDSVNAVLSAGSYSVSSVPGLPLPSVPISIVGASPTTTTISITSSSITNLFYFTADAYVSNIDISGATANSYTDAFALLYTNVSLTVDNCTFQHNSFPSIGGTQANITVLRSKCLSSSYCILTSECLSVSIDGSSFENAVGQLIIESDIVSLTRSYFYGNSPHLTDPPMLRTITAWAPGLVNGGTLLMTAGLASITDTIFEANSGTGEGGHMYFTGEGNANITIERCQFFNGRLSGATGRGVGFLVELTNFIFDSVFIHNNTGDPASGVHAGGIYTRYCPAGTFRNVTIVHNTVYDNLARTGRGGAMFCLGPSDGQSYFIIDNSYFGYNQAATAGGAFFALLCVLIVTNSHFVDNFAFDDGQTVSIGSLNGLQLVLQDSYLQQRYGDSPCISTVYGNVVIQSTVIDVPGVFAYAGAGEIDLFNLTVTGTILLDSSSKLQTDTVQFIPSQGNTTVILSVDSDLVFAGSSFVGCQQAISATSTTTPLQYTLIVTDTVFSSNNLGISASNLLGVRVLGSQFYNNVGEQGPAISVSMVQVVTINGCDFVGNAANISSASDAIGSTTFGGAVYGLQTVLRIINSNFFYNTASKGGAVYLDQFGTLSVQGCNFTGNFADGSQASQNTGTCAEQLTGFGGAIFVSASTLVDITNTEFRHNSAVEGGGIYLNIMETSRISNSSFMWNSANNGGAMAVYDAAVVVNNTRVEGQGFYFGDPPSTLIVPAVTSAGVNTTLFYPPGGVITNLITTMKSSALVATGPPMKISLQEYPTGIINYNIVIGSQFSPQLEPRVFDSLDNFLSTFGSTQMIAQISAAGAGTGVNSTRLEISGGNVRPVFNGTANFSDFNIVMAPGTNVTLVFSMYYLGNAVQSRPYTVTARPCIPGEELVNGLCLPCAVGTVSTTFNANGCFTCSGTLIPHSSQGYCVCSAVGNGEQQPPCIVPVLAPRWARILFYVCAGIVAAIILASMVLVWIFRRNRVIYYASPVFCQLILFGAMLVLISAVLAVASNDPATCTARVWLLPIGFSFSFGTIFARTYRLYKVFNNPKLRVKAIKNYQLFAMIMVLVGIDVVILAVWVAIAPYKTNSVELPICVSQYSNIFAGILLAIKAIVLLFGAVLSYRSRNLPTAYNETSLIAGSIYAMAALALITILIAYAFPIAVQSRLIAQSFLIIFNALGTVMCIFFPKFYKIYNKEDGLSFLEEWKRQQAGPTGPSGPSGPGGPGEKSRNKEKSRELSTHEGSGEFSVTKKNEMRAKWEERLKQVEASADTLTAEIYKLATAVDQTKKKFDMKKDHLKKAEALRAFIYQELDLIEEGGAWDAISRRDIQMSKMRSHGPNSKGPSITDDGFQGPSDGPLSPTSSVPKLQVGSSSTALNGNGTTSFTKTPKR